MTEEKPGILVVDDQSSIGLVLQAGLQLHGFTVRYESRSSDAVKTCLEFQPDLVLLDVDMPFGDEGEVAAEMQVHPALRHTPVIFLTSLVSEEEAKQSSSGKKFLSKPIPLEELVARVRAVLQLQTQP